MSHGRAQRDAVAAFGCFGRAEAASNTALLDVRDASIFFCASTPSIFALARMRQPLVIFQD